MTETTEWDETRFARAFHDKYLSTPFGTLSKSETEFVLFSCLVDAGYVAPGAAIFDVARTLRVTPTRARNLVYQYKLRTMTADTELAELAAALTIVGFDDENEIVTLGIEDPYLRDVLVARLKSANLFTNTSFNRELVQVKLYQFVQAMYEVFSTDEMQVVLDKLQATDARKRVDELSGLTKRALKAGTSGVVSGALGSAGRLTLDALIGLVRGSLPS